MNWSPVSSDLLPGELKNSAVMNPSRLSTLEILQVILKQRELLRKDSAAQQLLDMALLSQPHRASSVGWLQQISNFLKS